MNNNFKDEKIGNNEDNFDDQNGDDDNNDNDIDERQQKLQQSIDDAFIQHPLKTSSSSSLSHKKLSPRSSSYSVSFNIDTIKFDNNKNRTSNMPNLQSTSPPPPPQNTLSMTDNVTPTASSIPLSNVNNQSDLNENESQANRLQPMMITPPPPPSPPPPSFPISSPPPPMPSSSFLSETNQSTKGNHDNNAIGVSRTNSSASIPDYLSQKLDTQSNKAIKATAALNLLKSKRKSIAVSSMLRHNDSLSSLGINHFKQQLQQLQQQKPLHIVKESSDSSTSTTTSESYHINDLPTTLPVKLASLSKPPTTPFSFHSSFRRARHSIDVRALPSYLSKKRQSTFGQLLSVLSPTVQENESTSSDDQLFEEPIAPTLSLGERVAWIRSSGPEFGIVKWIGRMPQITNDWTVGIEFDNAIGSGDGTVDGRRYFVAKENFAKFLPISELTKVDNYAGRPRSGTMLSRMSVQLKPGQLISIQRSPTTTVPHCYLNAPHHVGHDVHAPNNRHCQCNSCNHPCAHICKTRKPKGKRWTEDMAHMCHFSSKPHANMCCGGEDLAAAFEPIKPGTSWKHSNVITSFRTVPTEIIHHRKSTITHSSINMHLLREPSDLLLKKSSTSSSAKQQQPGPTNSSPNFYHDHDHDHHHHHREHLDSGLMERTGSELSISSLPSSSSVAEIYISRPVLTDESDIDSETERSLDSKAKENNKQGFRSLVACFLANSLRLKSMKSYAEKVNNKKNKSSDRSHLRRHKFSDKNNQSNYQQSFENRKLKKNRPIQRLGLSSTDTSYNLDIPNSSVANTQPNNSFSSDFPHQNHQNNDNERQQQLPTTSSSHQLQKSPSVTSSQTSATITSTTFSPKPYLSGNSAKQNFFNAKNSPYRMNEMMQQHHIDGHISEEITNSSSSTSTQRNTTKTESSEKRTTSNYASSENFQSPRRRRNKGPAPKPPNKNDKNHNHMKQSTECSSSPLSVNDAVSTSCNSIPMSLSNSSLSTTNCSNTKLIMTKSPMRQQQQQPPNLVRSLSEQKQLNMKNLINAMPSFRSEINLQEMNLNENNNNDENEIIEKNVKINDYDKSNQECIYEIPLCGKNLLNNNKNNYNSDKNVASVIKNNDIIPELPEKTFDPLKVFGCPMNMETKRLEKSSHHNDLGQEQQQISIQPSIDVDKDKSKPYSKYTCCMYHWKEFLESTSTIEEMNRITEEIPEDLLLLDNNDVCDCDKTSMTTMIDDPDIISDLTNALLSPKHSIKLKKNDFRRQLSKDENQRMKINNNNNDDNNIDNLLNEMNNFELTRAMSDSSLTNTNSATTVVEYNENNKDNETIDNLRSIFNNKNNNETVSQPHNLKDVFVQTSFKNLSEKSPTTATVTTTRRCKHNKHCRCRAARYRNHHRKDCRHQQHACTLHNECCLPSATVNNSITNSLYLSVDDNHKKLSNIWLTSSTSDHSLSSLSSSNSTLSETPSHIRHKNDINSRNYYHIAPSITSNTWSAATPMITKFNRPSITSESEQKKILPEDLVSTQQSIYTEKMYRNTQDNIDHNQIQMQTFPTGTISRKTKKSKDSAQNFNDGYQNKNDPNSWSRCLLSQLETAIANGDHHSASIIAKELAFKKVNCSFIAGKFGNSSQSDIVSGCDYPIVTYLYIEDNMSHKGPIPFQLYPSMSVKMLKIKVEKEFDIPSELQQWIFGKNLAINMDASLSTYGITHSGCSIFLQIKNNDNNGKDFEKDLNLPASMSNEEKLIDINTFNTTNDTANGDLFEKDDDSIYESLRLSNDNDDELPPYSTTIVADNNDKISNKKLHVQTINDEKSINYIQNPLASLEFDVINTISSRTSFNETIQTIASNEQNLSSMTTTTTNTKFFYPENIINIDQSSSSYPKELVFESLNFINEMLPRVEEENEDELEEYDDDDDDDDGNEDNENNKHDINDLQNKIGNINHNEKENSVNEKFDCPKRLLGTEINNDYTKSDQEQIKCLSCDNNNSNKSNENEITNRDIVIN